MSDFGECFRNSYYPRIAVTVDMIATGTEHIAPSHFATLRKHEIFAGDLVIAALGESLPRACLVARPIGLHVLRPTQTNRTWLLIEPKLRRSKTGRVEGYGLKCFP